MTRLQRNVDADSLCRPRCTIMRHGPPSGLSLASGHVAGDTGGVRRMVWLPRGRAGCAAGGRHGVTTVEPVVLLHNGARIVVATVALVSDTSACRVAQAHHRGLQRGQVPATALAAVVDV